MSDNEFLELLKSLQQDRKQRGPSMRVTTFDSGQLSVEQPVLNSS